MNRMRHARGFTLVEILIVVVILGIISSIVVPQVSLTSREARATQVASQLQVARTQMMYFNARTGGFPGSVTSGTDWSDMIDGGYFPRAPRNALRGNATGVIAGNGGPGANASAADTVGWYWCVPLEILYAIDDEGVIVDDEVGLIGLQNGGDPYQLQPAPAPLINGLPINAPQTMSLPAILP